MPWWLLFLLFMLVFVPSAVLIMQPMTRRGVQRIKQRRARRAVAKKKAGTAIAIPEPDQPVYETYGHPWAPIPELVAKLPRPPANYSWEITALLNSYGSPALRLALLDLRSSEVSDFIERDLVVIRRWRYAEDDTFASFYRRAKDSLPYGTYSVSNFNEIQKNQIRKVFYAHLLAPMVDWATAIAASKAITEPPALVSNYKLVQGQVA